MVDETPEEASTGNGDELRRPELGGSGWSQLTRANSKALRKRPDVPVWTSQQSKRGCVTLGLTGPWLRQSGVLSCALM